MVVGPALLDRFLEHELSVLGGELHRVALDVVQDTGLLRTLRLHNIERHSVQLTPEDAKKILDEAVKAGTVHGVKR